MNTKKIEIINEIYTNFDYKDNINFIKQQAKERKTLLDTNCRNATMLTMLQDEGFEVSGLVSSRKMQKKIQEETNCNVQKKSPLKMKKLGKFQVITSLFSALNKYKNYVELDIALNKMTKCLDEDGIIIIDLIKNVKEKSGDNNNTLLEKSKIKKSKKKVKVVNVYKKDNKKFVFKSKYKLFEIEKVSNIAKKNGLKIIDFYRDYKVKIPDEYGDNVQIVLTKNTEETEKEAKKRKRQFVTKKGKVKVFKKRVYFSWIIIMACLGVVCGTWVGDYYNSTFANSANFEYNEADITSAMGDVSTLDATKAPDQLGVVKAFMLAEYTAKSNDFTIIESGQLDISMGVNIRQIVKGSIVSKNGIRTRISASSDASQMMPVAAKTVFNTKTNTITQYSGKPTDMEKEDYGITWDEGKEMTTEEFRADWGVNPSWFVPYVICEKTVAEFTTFEKNEKGHYTATLSLKTRQNASSADPCQLMAYTYYVKQIAKMSGVTVTDVEFCNITFTIDSDYKFKNIKVEEKYSIRYGVIPVTCPANLNQEFSY